MADPRECAACPMRGVDGVPGAAVVTGHSRFCERNDPGHPDYDPTMAAVYRRYSFQLAGKPAPVERAEIEARRAAKRRIPLGTKIEPG